MKLVVEKYPESEVSEMAGMILRGVQQGRQLHGGKFDISDIWSRRNTSMLQNDSLQNDTLRFERNVSYVFLLAYQPDSVNQNQLLYELAKYNFTNYLVRNFEIEVEHGDGVSRMLIRGFMSYDEVRQYVRMLYADPQMQERLQNCRHLIISDDNLQKVGTSFSYNDYDEFYERELAPLEISDKELLGDPEELYEEPEEDYEEPAPTNSGQPGEFDDLFGPETPGSYGDIDFDEDFYR